MRNKEMIIVGTVLLGAGYTLIFVSVFLFGSFYAPIFLPAQILTIVGIVLFVRGLIHKKPSDRNDSKKEQMNLAKKEIFSPSNEPEKSVYEVVLKSDESERQSNLPYSRQSKAPFHIYDEDLSKKEVKYFLSDRADYYNNTHFSDHDVFIGNSFIAQTAERMNNVDGFLKNLGYDCKMVYIAGGVNEVSHTGDVAYVKRYDDFYLFYKNGKSDYDSTYDEKKKSYGSWMSSLNYGNITFIYRNATENIDILCNRTNIIFSWKTEFNDFFITKKHLKLSELNEESKKRARNIAEEICCLITDSDTQFMDYISHKE